LGDSIFGYNGEQMEEIVGEELKRQGKTLSVAESCTGGYLSHLLTSIPGSSEYFKGGFIAYSNEFKIDKLEVEPYIIEKYGAVSIETVEAMAKASLEKTNTDYSIAISGIAGPDGGTQEKPVGTVCIAVFDGNEMKSYQYQFSSNRIVNIRRAAIMSLNLLRLMVQ
jgi:nicotinamide-nucleotide amidase